MRREFKNKNRKCETCKNEERLVKLKAIDYSKALLADTLLSQFKGHLPARSDAFYRKKKDIKNAKKKNKETIDPDALER